MESEQKSVGTANMQPYVKTRLTISIINVVLGLYVMSMADKIDAVRVLAAFGRAADKVGTNGMGLAVCLLIAGITGIVAHFKPFKQSTLISGIFCGLGALTSLDVGVFQDLYFLNTVAIGFCAFLIFVYVKKVKPLQD